MLINSFFPNMAEIRFSAKLQITIIQVVSMLKKNPFFKDLDLLLERILLFFFQMHPPSSTSEDLISFLR